MLFFLGTAGAGSATADAAVNAGAEAAGRLPAAEITAAAAASRAALIAALRARLLPPPLPTPTPLLLSDGALAPPPLPLLMPGGSAPLASPPTAVAEKAGCCKPPDTKGTADREACAATRSSSARI